MKLAKTCAEPACHCAKSTPWLERHFDGPWFIDGEIIGYQRTCTKCNASKTIDVKDAPREDVLSAVRASVAS